MSQVSSTRRLLGASAVMASGTMISRVLGVVRVALVAFILGNGTRQADMLDIANMVPNALYILLAGGALNTVLVPQIVRAVKNDEDGGEAYTNRIMTAFLLAVTVIAVVITAAAPFIIQLYTSDAWRQPDLAAQYASMVALAYLTLPQIFFYGAFFLLGQVLNARDKFGPMMWAPIANNVISILVLAIYLVVWGGDADRSGAFTTPQILLLGIGSTVGIAVQMLVLLPYLRKVGFSYRPRFDLKGTGLGKTFGLAKWTFAFVGINQLAYMVVQKLATAATATGHGAGSNVYSNAHLLWILPHSLITVSLATAMLPSASRLAAAGDNDGVSAEFTKTVRLALIAIVPATIAFFALAGPISGILFGHGAGAHDAAWIAWALMAFAVGLIPFTVQFLCLRTFYALEDTRTPFLLQVLIAGVNVVAALLLTWAFDDPAWVAAELALAYSIAYAVGVPVSWRVLKRRVPGLDGRKLALHILRLLIGSVVGGAAAYYLAGWLLRVVPGRVLGQLAALAAGGVVTLAVYYVIGRLLKVRELSSLGDLVAARRGRPAPAAVDGSGEAADEPRPEDPPTLLLPPAPGPAESIDLETTGPLDFADIFRPQPREQAEPEPSPAAEEPVALAAPLDDDEDDPTETRLPAPEVPEDEPLIAREGLLLSTRYELLSLLAARHGTETWRAHDHSLSRDVLVHVVATGDDRIVQLQAAARKGAAATDSRFLRVLDAVDLLTPAEGVGGYVVAEYAAGRSLTELLSKGPMSTIEAAYVVRELADALVPVHAKGLFHEQLNPDNVIITDVGAVKLVGFGLEAVLADRGDQWSRAWSVRQHDDVVGLGNLLYAMLVARWPGAGDFGLPPAPLVAGEPAPPHEVLVGVSFALDRICTTTITERGAAGERRITTAAQLAAMLGQVLGTANASADLEARVRAWSRTPAATPWVPAAPAPAAGSGAAVSAAVVGSAPVLAAPLVPAPVGYSPVAPEATPVSGVTPPRVAAAAPRSPHSPIAAPRENRDAQRRVLWVILALAVVALVVSLIIVGAMNAKDNAAPAGASTPATSSTAPGSTPASSPAATGPIAIVSASDFDPETDGGNGEENPQAVAKAYDGDPATFWETLRYKNRPNLGGLKPGVGLVLDLGEERTVTAVDLTLSADNPDDTTSVEVRVPEGSKPSTRTEADWRVVGSNDAAKGTVTLTLTQPEKTRYLLVYFTKLPPTANGFKARLNEVSVK
ncbi:MAG: murein biosynthesis integral membrane protein MurJ [Arachnia sp.]